jgi:hypothetical protein
MSGKGTDAILAFTGISQYLLDEIQSHGIQLT